MTTAIAISIAMIVALILQPGVGQSELLDSTEVEDYRSNELDGETGEAIDQTFDQTLINIIPTNIIEAMGLPICCRSSHLQSSSASR